MIDTHCHLDMFDNPLHMAELCQKKGLTLIGVTNLPSHYELGESYVRNFSKIRLALGFHPLFAEQFNDEYEIFERNVDKCSYIGEVGLDFSDEGKKNKQIQLQFFSRIINLVKNKKKILSLHSRRAEKEVLEILKENKISNAIFHWYSGPIHLIDDIINSGYYLSINFAMINSSKGKKIVENVPKRNILIESDSPFIKIKNRSSKPWDIKLVYEYLAKHWHLNYETTNNLIKNNFYSLINNIR